MKGYDENVKFYTKEKFNWMLGNTSSGQRPLVKYGRMSVIEKVIYCYAEIPSNSILYA